MKVVTIAFAAIGMAMVACGGGGFDEEECKEAEKSVNQAVEDCTGTAGTADFSCGTYAAAADSYGSCDFTAYYDAWKDYYTCDTATNTIKTGDTLPNLDCGG